MKIFDSKFNIWLAIIAVILTIIFYIFPNPFLKNLHNLCIVELSKSPLITLNEDLSGLSIRYQNVDLKENHKNITILTLRVINNGNEPILKEYFDNSFSYGINFKNCALISRPDIIGSSNMEYYSSVVQYYNDSTITFKPLIIDPEEYFDIKFLLLHDEIFQPEYKSYGKIANQKEINFTKLRSQASTRINSTMGLMYSLSGVLFGILVSVTIIILFKKYKKIHMNNQALLKEIVMQTKPGN